MHILEIINQKTQDPFVALLSAAFSFLWAAEAQNDRKRPLRLLHMSVKWKFPSAASRICCGPSSQKQEDHFLQERIWKVCAGNEDCPRQQVSFL